MGLQRPKSYEIRVYCSDKSISLHNQDRSLTFNLIRYEVIGLTLHDVPL